MMCIEYEINYRLGNEEELILRTHMIKITLAFELLLMNAKTKRFSKISDSLST